MMPSSFLRQLASKWWDPHNFSHFIPTNGNGGCKLCHIFQEIYKHFYSSSICSFREGWLDFPPLKCSSWVWTVSLQLFVTYCYILFSDFKTTSCHFSSGSIPFGFKWIYVSSVLITVCKMVKGWSSGMLPSEDKTLK